MRLVDVETPRSPVWPELEGIARGEHLRRATEQQRQFRAEEASTLTLLQSEALVARRMCEFLQSMESEVLA